MSHIGEPGFGALAQGKVAMLIAPPDTPHDFAYVPDIARAVVTLLDAPDDAYNQVWNMPCAPTLTPRQILRLGAEAIGVKARVMAIPLPLLPLFGLFVPFLREVADVGFTWDRPYIVDGAKFMRPLSGVCADPVRNRRAGHGPRLRHRAGFGDASAPRSSPGPGQGGSRFRLTGAIAPGFGAVDAAPDLEEGPA